MAAFWAIKSLCMRNSVGNEKMDGERGREREGERERERGRERERERKRKRERGSL